MPTSTDAIRGWSAIRKPVVNAAPCSCSAFAVAEADLNHQPLGYKPNEIKETDTLLDLIAQAQISSGVNPIAGPTRGSGVGVSGKRERAPDILDVEEVQKLLAALGVPKRAMVFLDLPSGLRRGELAGLKWEDFDFQEPSRQCHPFFSRPACRPCED